MFFNFVDSFGFRGSSEVTERVAKVTKSISEIQGFFIDFDQNWGKMNEKRPKTD